MTPPNSSRRNAFKIRIELLNDISEEAQAQGEEVSLLNNNYSEDYPV